MSDDDFRDPVELLSHAMDYLIATRGEGQAKASQAWRTLNLKKTVLEMGCIQELLGEFAKANGVRCHCPRHPPEPPIVSTTPKQILSGRDRASGERVDE